MKVQLNYPNLETICRLCLKENAGTVSIFNTNTEPTACKQISIPMRIMACAALEVQTSDGLPKLICSDCRYQLEKSFYFRKRAQLADSKLRKHIRIVGAGRVSRIFNKDQDSEEDDEEELEFEDSLKFIKEQDDLIAKDKEEKDATKYREDFEKELERLKKSYAEDLEKNINVRCAALKIDIWRQSKKTFENELRAKIRAECLAEVKEESRKIEMEHLLNDLELYLEQKRLKVTNRTSISENSPKKVPNAVTKTSNLTLKALKRSRTPDSLTTRVTRQRKYQDKTEETETLQETYEVISKEIISINSEHAHEAENFYILDTESNVDKVDYLEQLEDENYVPSEEGEFQTCENPANADTAVYEIEEMVGMGREEEILYLDMDVTEEEQTDMPEFPSSKTKSKKKSSTFYATSKSKEGTKIAGFTKVALKPASENSKTEPNEQPRMGASTDTPKTFKCEMCPMSFSTMKTLTRHHRTHERSEKLGIKYECDECHVVFSCRSALTRHAVVHTGKRPYKCEECGKSFVQREILKRHQLVHTGERPFQCPHCSRAYSQKVNLQQHVNHYHSEKPKLLEHTCHLCPKRFNHASGLSRHLASHSGISYLCVECNRCFIDRSSVKRHVLTVHMASGESSDIASKFIKECINDSDSKQTANANNDASE